MRAGVFFAEHRNFVDGETQYFFAEDGFASAAASAFRYVYRIWVGSLLWLRLLVYFVAITARAFGTVVWIASEEALPYAFGCEGPNRLY